MSYQTQTQIFILFKEVPSTPVPPEEETQKGTPRPTRSTGATSTTSTTTNNLAGATSTKPDKQKHISSAGLLTSEAVVIGACTVLAMAYIASIW